MKGKYVFFILVGLNIAGCNRPDPNPELKDPIYLDIQKELLNAKKEIESEEKQLEEFKKVLASVVPQTGQIKFAQKRVTDSVNRLVKLKQMHSYWQIRLNTRIAESKRLYAEAFAKDKPWPDQAEWNEYRSIRKAQVKPRLWSLEDRFKELGIERRKPASKLQESKGKE